MRIRENQEAAKSLLQSVRDRQPSRTGLHLSSLITCTRKAWAKYHDENMEEDSDDFTIITLLGKGHHNMLEKQAEITYEKGGITFTPDEVQDTGLVIEYKTTRYSAKKTPADMATYVDQLGGYCSLLDLDNGRLVIFHLMGVYKPPFPILKVYDLEFSKDERYRFLKELGRRQRLVVESKTMDEIPLSEHFDWECEYCPLKGKQCPGGSGERLTAFPMTGILEKSNVD